LSSIYIDLVYQTFIVWHKNSTINSSIFRDDEIVGIAIGESGRNCERHEVSGDHVAVDDFFKFKLVVVEVDGEEEDAIKAIKIRDDTESFHVGFLPCHFVHGSRKEAAVKKFGQVLDL
jgi:hypothetical protein